MFDARAKAKFIHEVIPSTVPHRLRGTDKKLIEYAEDLAGELWGVPPHRYAKETSKTLDGSSKKKRVKPEDEDHSPSNPKKKKKPTAPRTTEKGTKPAGENIPRPERTTTKVADKKNTKDRKPEDKVLSDDQVLRRVAEALKKEHATPNTPPTELLSALRVDAQVEGTSTRLFDNCRWADWLRDQRKTATRAEGKPRVSLQDAIHMLRANRERMREYFEMDD